MSKTILVRVNKIEAYRDLNGSLGKKIDLVEEPPDLPNAIHQPEELAMVMGIVSQLQKQMPGLMQMQIPVSPKLILYLTEDEYDALGTTLDVNQTYQVEFSMGKINFLTKSGDGPQ